MAAQQARLAQVCAKPPELLCSQHTFTVTDMLCVTLSVRIFCQQASSRVILLFEADVVFMVLPPICAPLHHVHTLNCTAVRYACAVEV
jgi:hypothetical protein